MGIFDKLSLVTVHVFNLRRNKNMYMKDKNNYDHKSRQFFNGRVGKLGEWL